MSKIVKIGIITANNMEDMEFIIPFDIWRRAKFVVETIACEVKSHALLHYSNLKINTNFKLKLTNLEQYDLLYFPGGPAFRAYLTPPATAKDMGESKLHTSIKKFYKNPDKWLVSICAAPISLLTILEGEMHENIKFTCYNDPKLIGDYSKLWVDKPIVIHKEKNFITAQAASCATQLAFLVVELFNGKEEAVRLAKTILYDYVSPLENS